MNLNENEMRNLKDNWDSYGAAPINPKAIDIAESIIEKLEGYTAAPCPDGSVQLEIHLADYSVEIVISAEDI
jgi:hypothetical protein